MGVQRYARRDESIKGAEFALKQGKKKSWLKYVLVFGLIFFACWYERNFLAQAAEKIRKLPDWTIFIIIVLSLTYSGLGRNDHLAFDAAVCKALFLDAGREMFVCMQLFSDDNPWKRRRGRTDV